MDSQGNSWRSFCGVLIWCWLQWSLKLSLSANSGQWVSKFYFQNTADLLRVHCSDMIVKLFFCLVKLPAWKKTFLTVNSVFFFFLKSFQNFLQSLSVLWPISVPQSALATLEGCETHRVTVTECKLEKIPREIYFYPEDDSDPHQFLIQNTESAKMVLLFLIFFLMS